MCGRSYMLGFQVDANATYTLPTRFHQFHSHTPTCVVLMKHMSASIPTCQSTLETFHVMWIFVEHFGCSGPWYIQVLYREYRVEDLGKPISDSRGVAS